MHSINLFAVFLPVGEGLGVAAIVLGIYRLRLRQAKQQKQDKKGEFSCVQYKMHYIIG